MQKSPDDSSRERAFFLTPEPPAVGLGGGSMRSASLLAYLREKYDVEVGSFTLPDHSRVLPARVWRNSIRFLRGRPPLFDRYSGHRDRLQPQGRYRIAVVEHFWCAPYADLLRPHTDLLVLDMHNVESALARSHACAVYGIEALMFRRFASAYERLEREWLPHFDLILATSDEDRERITKRLPHMEPTPCVEVYPNALPGVDPPEVPEENAIVFSGNMEYFPNIEAVRWFYKYVWLELRDQTPDLEWRLIGRNPQAIRRIVEDDDRRVRIIGPVDDAVAEIAKAKVCVVPLLSGSGTRFKILEAWAARRAVVSTSLGAEGLGGRTGAHLLIADAADAFRDAIVMALASAETRRKLGECGHFLYKSRYTWPRAWAGLDVTLDPFSTRIHR